MINGVPKEFIRIFTQNKELESSAGFLSQELSLPSRTLREWESTGCYKVNIMGSIERGDGQNHYIVSDLYEVE